MSQRRRLPTEPSNIQDGVLIIPESWTEIPADEFSGSSGFQSVRLPSHPLQLNPEVFRGCADLRDFVFPDWVQDIPEGFLSVCEHLTSVRLSEGLQSIGEGAFFLCETLAETEFPSTLKSIGSMAFYGTALQEVSLPSATESLGMEAFGACPNLQRIEVFNPSLPGNAFFLSDPNTGNETLLENDTPCGIRSGFLAKGVPDSPEDPCWKWYALLWSSEPVRHSSDIERQITQWISEHEEEFMELIFQQQNVEALRTVVKKHCLNKENLETYRARALDLGNPELTTLLLDAEPASPVNLEEEFAL